jgi:ATP-dependent helicase/nuclease subunit A
VTAMTDSDVRGAVLEPTRSFIVQAPAGSGKTELLIRRYLALLATVQNPEQIVAITFTRKAAAEMRRRVQRALRAAAEGATSERAHEQETLALAQAAIARDRELGWSLLEQPQRLRIDTLDAFNVWLAQQLPVLAGGVAAARIVDDATDYYRQAARRTLARVDDSGALGRCLRVLVREIDGDFETLEKLLAALLPKRDQWLRPLAAADAEELRALLEQGLQRLIDDELAPLAAAWPDPLFAELAAALQHAAQFGPDGERRAALAPWLEIDGPPHAGHTALAAWQAAAGVLLTREGAWRRNLTKKEGFGPAHAAARARLQQLLEQLAPDDGLRARLRSVAELPDPHYDERQWAQLAALQVVVLHLAAELKVSFAEARSVDFAELGIAARGALGQVDAPSELLLALDRRIQHLLVDEFQDTSLSQLALLELLTAGWEEGDGRTLFLVGDPMQSIYRFRDADISRFLRAKQLGIGDVRLTSVTLERNFRSAPRIVDWVNGVFATVFPAEDRIEAGSAGFRASVAVRDSAPDQQVRVHALRGGAPRAEIARVLEILGEEQARDAAQSIAVLVQSRSHLAGLRDSLRDTGWPVHAIEIDTLEDQQLAQDLLGLTRALVHPGDRIAWLAVLRAPWCGLTWSDLHELCHDVRRETIWQALHDAVRLDRLSADGRRRALRTRAALSAALATRASTSFVRWVERSWELLGGPACLDSEADFGVAEQFFALLARGQRHGDTGDPARLHELLSRAPPQSEPPRGHGIEIMTMHRAKGLEFDTVVLLGLGREPRGDDSQALYWLRRVTAEGADDLLIADRLSAFVRRAERMRNLAERARLLYVATTRARERLHVVCELGPDREAPAPSTLLAHLWPAVQGEFAELPPPAAGRGAPPDACLQPVLRRLVVDTTSGEATAETAPVALPAVRPEFEWAGPAAVHVGTVVHRYLQQIADQGVASWNAASIPSLRAAFRSELELLGVERIELAAAVDRVVAALAAALEDPQGRWLLDAHEAASSELRLTLRGGGALEHVRIDRTFVADGVRWIVDFKTSRHEGGDREMFVESEVDRYRPQLTRYAAALAAVDPRPVTVGLYFPLLKVLRSWPIPTAATTSP